MSGRKRDISSFRSLIETLRQVKKQKTTHHSLHLAVSGRYKFCIDHLLHFDEWIEREDRHGNRALHLAARLEDRSILKLILDSKANLYSRNHLGCSALHIAAQQHRFKNVQLLLECGADVNMKTEYNGDTALHVAVRGEHKKVVLALLMYGADPKMINRDGYSPIFLAFSYPHHTLDDMLPSDQNILKLLVAFCVLWDINEWESACLTDNLSSSFKPFCSECEEEIRVLKLSILEKSRLSYYDILTCDIRQIAYLLRKDRMKVILMSNHNLESFPIYSEMLKFKIDAGKKRELMIEKGIKCLKNLLNNYFVLPDLIAENILFHVELGDLRNLIHIFECIY